MEAILFRKAAILKMTLFQVALDLYWKYMSRSCYRVNVVLVSPSEVFSRYPAPLLCLSFISDITIAVYMLVVYVQYLHKVPLSFLCSLRQTFGFCKNFAKKTEKYIKLKFSQRVCAILQLIY